jgi:hypothetical protein
MIENIEYRILNIELRILERRKDNKFDRINRMYRIFCLSG